MFSGVVVAGRVRLEGFLSEGGFGQVYIARDLHTNATAAAKIERLDCVLPLLVKEAKCLQELDRLSRAQGKSFLPKFYCAGNTVHFRYMLMELCGRNVRELKKFTLFDRFSVHTSLWIAKQMLEAVQFMHCNGWIHRDIKPPNFCISINGTPRRLILIDFGTVERRQDTTKTVGFCGTERYASLRTHLKLSAHESDDLWAIYYIAVENINGQLPWRKCVSREEIARQKRILVENPNFIFDRAPHPWFPIMRVPFSLKIFLRLLACGHFNFTYPTPQHYEYIIAQIERDLVELNFNDIHSLLDWEMPISAIPVTMPTTTSVYAPQIPINVASMHAYQLTHSSAQQQHYHQQHQHYNCLAQPFMVDVVGTSPYHHQNQHQHYQHHQQQYHLNAAKDVRTAPLMQLPPPFYV